VGREHLVNPVVLAVASAYGVHLLYSSLVLGWRGLAPGPVTGEPSAVLRHRLEQVVEVADVSPRELMTVLAGAAAVGGFAAWAVFGGLVSAALAGGAAATTAFGGLRARATRRRSRAAEAWPQLIETIRVEAVTLGRSIPQALFEAGRAAPSEMQRAFEAARRTWSMSADLERALDVLRAGVSDATADAVCETLLVAHAVGGPDVDRCLRALADDRIADLQARKDAVAEQAGARFARAFTLVVPLGMAVVGMGIGDGRDAYRTPLAQVLVAAGLAVMAGCWFWASRVLRLPVDRRVFVGSS
jgi:tight adherence protein B